MQNHNLEMEISIYFEQLQKIRSFLLIILDNESDENDFTNLFTLLDNLKINENKELFKEFLLLISIIAKNYHKCIDFYKKIEKILQKYSSLIKQVFTNFEIFNLFKRNKQILLFLFENEIIKPDNNINKYIFQKTDKNGCKYRHFFFPEISPFFKKQTFKKVEQELLKIDPKIFDNFSENRKKGENDSYICELIRNDSVIEFIEYTSKKCISLKSKIKHSIFETNNFILNQKETTLIEYAAFYGSIQIFQFLSLNDAELNPSLWLYSIHSKNAELIHLLESKDIKPEDSDFNQCFEEAIKCHSNDIANYIRDNYIDAKEEKNAPSFGFRYRNFEYFLNDLTNSNNFSYACQYDYITLVRYFLKEKENLLTEIFKKFCFVKIMFLFIYF